MSTPDPNKGIAEAPASLLRDYAARGLSSGQRAFLLLFIAAPWCLLAALALINPRYESNLFDPAMPGLGLLGVGFIVQILGGVTLFVAYGLVGSLARRNQWEPESLTVSSILIGTAVSLLCLAPILLMVLFGPTFIVLLRAELP